MKKLVFIILLIVLYKYVFPGEILHTPGILVKEEPIQIQNSKELPNKKGWKFTAFASYTISGRVLGRNRYYSGPSADIAPVDIALGWNKMSDTAVIEKLNISMGNRFYFYQWSGIPPIPQYEIQCSSANNHMIAANSEIESRIKSLKVGELCTFSGYLVNGTHESGGTWNSSTTRADTGNGACEVFYVENVANYKGN